MFCEVTKDYHSDTDPIKRKNQLKNISLHGNKEEVLESLLQTLDASEAKKKS